MSVAATVVAAGQHTYQAHEDWMRAPQGCDVIAASVTVDSLGRIRS